MKKIVAEIILFIFLPAFVFGQNPEPPKTELLKNYTSYTHKFWKKNRWTYKYKVENGLVKIQENYFKGKLRHRAKFIYDGQNNLIKEITLFPVGQKNKLDTINYKLKYRNKRLVERKTNYGIMEKFYDFNEIGKPKTIEIHGGGYPHKSILEYDSNGNIAKAIEFDSIYPNFQDDAIPEKATTLFKYDGQNNVIEIQREFEPKREFPIIMYGGLAKYQTELFRYKYNSDGLWTKKYRTVEGKERLVARRRYK